MLQLAQEIAEYFKNSKDVTITISNTSIMIVLKPDYWNAPSTSIYGITTDYFKDELQQTFNDLKEFWT